MTDTDIIVLGGTGLIGSAVREHFEGQGRSVLSVGSTDYAAKVGARANILINCNGNAVRHLAQKDPKWDFEASVATVERSLLDFKYDLYIYISTVDVYNAPEDPARNHEDAAIRQTELHPYAFHKWLAERVVERFASRWVIARVGTVIGPGLKKNPVYDMLTGYPLHMSLDSELSLIDTPTIARCLEAIVGMRPEREIFNVAASGAVKLRDLQRTIGTAGSLAPGAELCVYRYNINNAKMARLIALPTSWEAVTAFLAQARTLQTKA
jgi:nucleoside-diphosphate-sugar epimerase